MNKDNTIKYNLFTQELCHSDLDYVKVDSFNFTEDDLLNDNLTKYIEDDKYYFRNHYLQYLKDDCKILYKAMTKFNAIMNKLFNINIFDFITISSIGDYYLGSYGVYDDCYEVCGSLKLFCQKAVRGGICCVRDNKPIVVETNKDNPIESADVNALYPSAMIKLDKIPVGKCRMIDKFDINSSTFKIVEIKITSINKYQPIPFVSYINGDRREYINSLPEGKPITLVVDSILLKEWIKYCSIKYSFVRGVEWSVIDNIVMRDRMQTLFDMKISYPSEKKAIIKTIKLLMNSCYGKTIVKHQDYTLKIFSNLDLFCSKNYNSIRDISKIGNKYIAKVNDVSLQYNRVHIGCSILSSSKKIMYSLLDKCNNVYYCDTDSMHLLRNDRIASGVVYSNNIGCCKDENVGYKCVLGMYLGKKIYYEDLGVKKRFKMKGIPSDSVLAKNEIYGDVESQYSHLLNGGSIKYNLLDGKCKFLIKNNYIQTLESFDRVIAINSIKTFP